MKQAQIDLLNVTKSGDVYTAEYWDEASENENNVTMQISEDSLIEHVEKRGWNENEYYNTNNGDIEVVITNPADYLSENLNEVVKDYIQANS